MATQHENIAAMRKKIDAQAVHIRLLEKRIHELRSQLLASEKVK